MSDSANKNYKETGHNRKREPDSKPQNVKELGNNLGLQKSPVCPIPITFLSGNNPLFLE